MNGSTIRSSPGNVTVTGGFCGGGATAASAVSARATPSVGT
ncbi:hypothetical protein [Kutzneria sp. NPDC052558]